MKPKKSDYEKASDRVSNSPRLSKHEETIFYEGWGDDPEHLKWVKNANVGDIEEWAKRVEDN